MDDDISHTLKTVRDAYFAVFGDQQLTMHICAVIQEIKDGKWPNDTNLTLFWTVQDVISKKDWHNDIRIIEHLVASMQARAVRGVLQLAGIDVENPEMFSKCMQLLNDTDEQTKNVTRLVATKAHKKYGGAKTLLAKDWDDLHIKMHNTYNRIVC